MTNCKLTCQINWNVKSAMQKLTFFTHCSILITTSVLFAYPQHLPHDTFQVINYGHQQETKEWTRPKTYDEIIMMLEDLESGELERRYSPMQLDRVNDYLVILAKEGMLPNESDEKKALEEDIYDLIYGEDSSFQLTPYWENSHEYMIIPAVLNSYSGYDIIQCGKISKAWKKTKDFVKKHKKAIIIGSVVVVAVAAVTVAVVVTASAASTVTGSAGTAGAAASGFESNSSKSNKTKSSERSSSAPSGSQSHTAFNEVPIFKSVMEDQISSFKENLAHENFFQTTPTGQGLSLEETGRAIGPLFAHESFNHFNNQLSIYPQFSQEVQNIASEYTFSLPFEATNNPVDFGHDEIDRRFTSNTGTMFSDIAKEVDFNALSYQARGETARSYGYYDQAVNDLTKAININPKDPIPYLQRSASYFDMGQYNKSIEDFNTFATQIEKGPEKIPFSTPEFTLGFAKGLPKGVYESGKGIMLFLGELVSHPIHTATQVYDAFSTLARLAREDQWGAIGEVLSPEIHQLVTQWDTLPSDKRGELAGYALGKHGADIAVPGAVAKMASKSAKSARELAAVLKNLQTAEGTLILETTAGIGNTARAGEIITTGKRTAFLGDELGFTAKEMGQLKQAGKLEKTVSNSYEILKKDPVIGPRITLLENAEKTLYPLSKEFFPESVARQHIHSTGVKTFPRPKGIPENYLVRITDRGAGMEYMHPTNTHISVRVMPGKPHSPHLNQQKPYVIQKKDGKAFDKHGNLVEQKTPEAHIPIEEFIYRE